MKIAFFLGAGASVQFEKPTTAQLRRELRDKYRVDGNELLLSLLEHHNTGDIEDVLQSIKELKTFFQNKGGDFFKSKFNVTLTKKGDFGFDLVTLNSKKNPKEKETISYDTFISSIEEIETIIENEIFYFYQWRHIHDERVVEVYNRIFQRLHGHEIRFGTTNYDRVIEEYCIRSKMMCIDGFKLDFISGRSIWQNGDYPMPYNDENVKKIWLYKLHGSLNWKEHISHGIVKTDDESKISLDEKYLKNLLIYPTISPKNGHTEEPFKTIRARFTEFLESADLCVVIGFSFRDEHVNDFLKKFLEKKKPFIVISPSMPDDLYRLINKNSYNFGYMGEENVVDVGNITIFRERFDLDTVDKILDVITSRGKIS